MTLQLDPELNEFCPMLFRTLDTLGLLPRGLSYKRDASNRLQRITPSEFEKYPRLLFGCIQRYNDVEAGFSEWESRLLREVESPTLREAHYHEIEQLRQWMVKRKEMFVKKSNLQHLRTSLYARVFQYLYPRRVLATSYCHVHKGNPDVVGKFNSHIEARGSEDRTSALADLERLLDSTFPDTVLDSVQKVRESFDGWQSIVQDAKASLLLNARYYRRLLIGEEPSAPPEAEAVEEITPIEEPEEV